ncbi:MAG: ATP-grasp domain-containing protein [Candidatus Wildermuthbacteria bacterium]|nr:ATP-grasp domain-containing protein [Candidatus Wildermuthbacteria bacterium]
MVPDFFTSWQRVIPGLGRVIQKMEEKTIIALGVGAFPRIIPSLFLRNYLIYAVRDAADLDALRNYAKIFCLEEKFPKIAKKVRSTSYLLGSFAFQAFLKSRRNPFRLLFYQTTPPIIKKLEEQGIDWIGNKPESFADVILKGDFRRTLKELNLPHIEEWKIPREEFLLKNFDMLFASWQRPVVVQRADFDVSGEQGTFFVKDKESWKAMYDILCKDIRYKEVLICPFIEGYSTSMLGCITHLGVLTSTLQLQLVDVPESLHGQLATGVFLGHDWGFVGWPPTAEEAAQNIVEKIGGFIAAKGFKGIFGIDFMYETKTGKIFPLECNPRFTGALPVYSLMTTYLGKTPPVEFFHIMAHLNINEPFDFDAVNKGLKERFPVSHISLTPKGAYEMKLPLKAGIYSFSSGNNSVTFQRPGAFLWELKNDSEFLIIDSIPRQGGEIIQNVPRLCKLIFRRAIASSSSEIHPEIGRLVTALSTALRKDQTPPVKIDEEEWKNVQEF